MIDMFGNAIGPERPASGQYKIWKYTNRYRKATSKEECCQNCKSTKVCGYHNKYYRKCVLMGVSRSEATDTRASYVCDLWKLRDIKNKEEKGRVFG